MAREQHEVQVRLVLKDDGSVALEHVGSAASKADTEMSKLDRTVSALETKTKSFVSGALAPMAALLGGAALVQGITRLTGGFLDMAKNVDNMKVRLKVLLGDVGEANKLFDDLAKYAGGVPFELQQVMTSATMLSGIMKGGRNEVMKWMPLIGDLAAAVGLGIEETTEQVMRMLSAGAASADRFRERGVLAMLGFQAGVSYSAEETAKKLWNEWEKSDSKIRGSTEMLAKTWEGTMSMFSDAWFKFNRAIADAGAWETLTGVARGLFEQVNKLQEEGKLDEWARSASKEIEEAVENATTLAGAIEDVYSSIKALDELGEVEIGPITMDLFGSRFGLPGVAEPSEETLKKINDWVESYWKAWKESIQAGAKQLMIEGQWVPEFLRPEEGAAPFEERPVSGFGMGPGKEKSLYTVDPKRLGDMDAHVKAYKDYLKKLEKAKKDHQKEMEKIGKLGIKAEEDFADMMEEVGLKIMEVKDGEVAAEIYRMEQLRDKRVEMLEAMQLNEAEYVAALMQIWEAFYLGVAELAEKETERLKKEEEDKLLRMKQLAEGVGQEMASSMTDFALTSIQSFDDMGQAFSNMIKGMLLDIARLTSQKMVTEPLAGIISGGIGSLFSGLGGLGGIFTSMFPGAPGGAVGGFMQEIFGDMAFEKGGVVPRTGIGFLHKGELVLPSYQGGGVIPIAPDPWDWGGDVLPIAPDPWNWGGDALPGEWETILFPALMSGAENPYELLQIMGYDTWGRPGAQSIPTMPGLSYASIWDLPRVTRPMMDLFGYFGLMPETNWGLPYYYFDQYGSFAEPLAALGLMTDVRASDLMQIREVAQMVAGTGRGQPVHYSNKYPTGIQDFGSFIEQGGFNKYGGLSLPSALSETQIAGWLSSTLQGLQYGLATRGSLAPEALLYGPEWDSTLDLMAQWWHAAATRDVGMDELADQQKKADYAALSFSRMAWDYLTSGWMYSLLGPEAHTGGIDLGMDPKLRFGQLVTAIPGSVGFPGYREYGATAASAIAEHNYPGPPIPGIELPAGYVPKLPEPWRPEDVEQPTKPPGPEEPWVPIPPEGPVIPPPIEPPTPRPGPPSLFEETPEERLSRAYQFIDMIEKEKFYFWHIPRQKRMSVLEDMRDFIVSQGLEAPQLPSYDVGGLAWNEHLAVLHSGEAVIRAETVQQNRGLIEDLLAGDVPRFQAGGIFDGGGMIGRGGGGGMTINLINQSGIQLEAEEGDSFYQFEEMVKTVVLRAKKSDPRFYSRFGG